MDDAIQLISSLYKDSDYIEKIEILPNTVIQITMDGITRKFGYDDTVELHEWIESY